MVELTESLIDFEYREKKRKMIFFKRCGICTGLLSCGLIVTGLIIFNIKCGSFNTDINLCELPEYCPIKSLCNGSDNL